jgi:hypothetical protein
MATAAAPLPPKSAGGPAGGGRAAAGAAAAAPPAAAVSVLPWLRVPVTFQSGSGVPLDQVEGMAPQLRDAIRTCERC